MSIIKATKKIKATKRINPHTNDEEIQCYNNLMPINCTYTQYPFTDINGTYIGFRDEDKPQILFGGVWEERYSSKSVFFRTEGGQANSKTTPVGGTAAPIGRTNGIQTEAIRNIVGEWSAYQFTACHDKEVSTSGSLYQVEGYKFAGRQKDSDQSAIIGLNASIQVPTGSEFRPVNVLMKIWKRYE